MLEREKKKTHDGAELSFQLNWKESRANNTTPSAHQRWSEMRTKELKSAHKSTQGFTHRESHLFCRWIPEDFKSSSSERAEPFNHTRRDRFTKLAFIQQGTVIYLCSQHAGTRRSCTPNPCPTLWTGGTESIPNNTNTALGSAAKTEAMLQTFPYC